MRRLQTFSLLCLIAAGAWNLCRADAVANPNIVLNGTITHAQNQTYVKVPFRVPAGVYRITVTFHYTGKKQLTRLDLGIFDPQRFRGSSGGNKDRFTISATDATPSYLPGPIVDGNVAASNCGSQHSARRDLALSGGRVLLFRQSSENRILCGWSAAFRACLVSR